MSRLDSFIRRMEAQRTCLNWAVEAIAPIPGPVFEIGLGNGRTYDHLREILPGRDIYVFEQILKAHPASVPPENRLYLGDAAETIPRAVAEIAARAALMHYDIGIGDDAVNADLAGRMAPLMADALAPGGIVVANIAIPVDRWTRLPEPEGVRRERYFLYRG